MTNVPEDRVSEEIRDAIGPAYREFGGSCDRDEYDGRLFSCRSKAHTTRHQCEKGRLAQALKHDMPSSPCKMNAPSSRNIDVMTVAE